MAAKQVVVTVQGGAAAQGLAEFRLSEPVQDTSTGQWWGINPIVAGLDGNGACARSLICTDDPAVSPQGAYWLIATNINRVQSSATAYYISTVLPPSVLLSALTPMDPPSTTDDSIAENIALAAAAALQAQEAAADAEAAASAAASAVSTAGGVPAGADLTTAGRLQAGTTTSTGLNARNLIQRISEPASLTDLRFNGGTDPVAAGVTDYGPIASTIFASASTGRLHLPSGTWPFPGGMRGVPGGWSVAGDGLDASVIDVSGATTVLNAVQTAAYGAMACGQRLHFDRLTIKGKTTSVPGWGYATSQFAGVVNDTINVQLPPEVVAAGWTIASLYGAAGYAWVAGQLVSYTGTTGGAGTSYPSTNAAMNNAGWPAPGPNSPASRYMSGGSGLTALPSTLDAAGITWANSQGFWAGVS